MEYDEVCLNYFLEHQSQLFDENVADSLEEAEAFLEDMLIDHWNDEIDYLENRIKSFQDEE